MFLSLQCKSKKRDEKRCATNLTLKLVSEQLNVIIFRESSKLDLSCKKSLDQAHRRQIEWKIIDAVFMLCILKAFSLRRLIHDIHCTTLHPKIGNKICFQMQIVDFMLWLKTYLSQKMRLITLRCQQK
jgi:hypothetical protein